MSGDLGFLDYRGYPGYESNEGYEFYWGDFIDENGYPSIPKIADIIRALKLKTLYDDFYELSFGRLTNILIFYYTFPLILLYLIEFQNVTFRRLAKRCDLQPKGAPIVAYIIALTIISGVAAFLGNLRRYLMKTGVGIHILRSGSALIVIGIIMVIKNNGLRWKTKSIYNDHSEHLLAKGKTSQENDFFEMFICNWRVFEYEITQKCVFLIAIMGEPISTFSCAVVAYVLLAITVAVSGRTVAKEEV